MKEPYRKKKKGWSFLSFFFLLLLYERDTYRSTQTLLLRVFDIGEEETRFDTILLSFFLSLITRDIPSSTKTLLLRVFDIGEEETRFDTTYPS